MEWNTGSARLGTVQARALVHKYCVTSLFSIASGVGDEIPGVKVERGTTGVREVVNVTRYAAAVVSSFTFYEVGVYSKPERTSLARFEHHPHSYREGVVHLDAGHRHMTRSTEIDPLSLAATHRGFSCVSVTKHIVNFCCRVVFQLEILSDVGEKLTL